MVHIRVFQAENVQEALRQVREELGPEARILETKQVKAKIPHWIRRPRVEVVAAAAPDSPNSLALHADQGEAFQTSKTSSGTKFDSSDSKQREYASAENKMGDAIATKDGTDGINGEFEKSGSSGRDRIGPTAERSINSRKSEDSPAIPTDQILNRLVAIGIEPGLADVWVSKALQRCVIEHPTERLLEHELVQLLHEQIPSVQPIVCHRTRQTRIAFVGATGVGKTSTVAKLAAAMAVDADLRPGILSLDTHRIGAVEPLQSYANLLNVPLSMQQSNEEVSEALERLSGCNLVLIDTPGLSTRPSSTDEAVTPIRHLQKQLTQIRCDEVHLILSLSSSIYSNQNILRHCGDGFIDRILLGKADESIAFGNILPLLTDSQIPLSYVTDGQRVPQDICVPTKTRLALAMSGLKPEKAW